MNKEQTLEVLQQHAHSPMGKQLIEIFTHGEVAEVPQDPERYAVHAQIVLAGNYGCAGALSVEPSGLLHMSQPGAVRDPNLQHAPPKPIVAEHYFETHQIVTLVVVRPLNQPHTPVIIQG